MPAVSISRPEIGVKPEAVEAECADAAPALGVAVVGE